MTQCSMNISKLLLSDILMQSMVTAPDEVMIDMMKEDIEVYKKVREENDTNHQAIIFNQKASFHLCSAQTKNKLQ
ncbi:hypothetical protein FZC35_00965 [Candidatus Cytomitobacter indipagum]|uniref:Uncharacterized protein n=1 Tax=Candidatus Cytomitobacter indipagum TaxID=2601575 RepID=A0A5C0UFB6_9PROT|nr:hypothetical protein [Candidatus Cytomitobacter indipagum]QEK37952.1 hypothetical protein FZC35_00965 [Candidatus Cytomitobacter indipagum]